MMFLKESWLFCCMWGVLIALGDGCPTITSCTCTTLKDRNKDHSVIGKKVVCAGTQMARITEIAAIKPDLLPIDTLHLDLSGNNIEMIKSGAFSSLKQLVKLDLSKNDIAVIEPGAFIGLEGLEKLDLSKNRLVNIDVNMFDGLDALDRLSLSGNMFSTIPEDSFTHLSSLTKVDFQTDYLNCDCHLAWIFKWQKITGARVDKTTKCSFPKSLHGRRLKLLKRKNLHCNWPVEIPLFELTPSLSQVVFEGDSLPLRCRVSRLVGEETEVVWVRNDKVVEHDEADGLLVNSYTTNNKAIIVHDLEIKELQVNHTGIWTCQVRTSRGNDSRSISIIVISGNMRYCESATTHTNRGVYRWPKTIVGVSQELPCSRFPEDLNGRSKVFARYLCSEEGTWTNLELDDCAYISEVTRILETFSKMNFSSTNPVSTVKSFRDYINNVTGKRGHHPGKHIADKMDVVYAARTVENLSQFLSRDKEIGSMLVDVVSRLMSLPEVFLTEAHLLDKSCTRLLAAINKVPHFFQSLSHNKYIYTENIALETYVIKLDSTSGILCTSSLHSESTENYTKSNFHCVPDSAVIDVATDRPVTASIHLSAALIQGLSASKTEGFTPKSVLIQFVIYRNSKLFPIMNETELPEDSIVTTSVISWRIVEVNIVDLTATPIAVELRLPVETADVIAVNWNASGNGGFGEWQTDGCAVVGHDGNLTSIKCTQVGAFAAVQIRSIVEKQLALLAQHIQQLKPIIYIFTGIMVICLLISLISYIVCGKYMEMPRKTKHSLINTWAALILLSTIFAFGINQTSELLSCKIVGMVLHYLSLCTVFWMTITANNLYKTYTKALQPVPAPIEPESEQPVPPKPMLRFYLVGWGIALIAVGITGAVSLDHYPGKQYCFLAWGEPSLGAFYGPVAFLLILNFIFYTRLLCILSAPPPPPPCHQTHARSEEVTNLVIGVAGWSNATEFERQHRPLSHLRANVFVIVLFVLAWTSAALATSHPFKNQLHNMEMIFSYAYCCLCAILGIFVLVFFCFSRSDTWRGCRSRCIDTSEAGTGNTIYAVNNPVTQPMLNGHVPLARPATSVDSGITNRSSNTSASHASYAHLVSAMPRNVLRYPPSHTATITDNSSVQESVPIPVQMYYNPRQNGAAKKYWERTRQRQVPKIPQQKSIDLNDLPKRHESIDSDHVVDKSQTDGDLEYSHSKTYFTFPRGGRDVGKEDTHYSIYHSNPVLQATKQRLNAGVPSDQKCNHFAENIIKTSPSRCKNNLECNSPVNASACELPEGCNTPAAENCVDAISSPVNSKGESSSQSGDGASGHESPLYISHSVSNSDNSGSQDLQLVDGSCSYDASNNYCNSVVLVPDVEIKKETSV